MSWVSRKRGSFGEPLGNSWHFQSVTERSSERPSRVSGLGRDVVTSALNMRDPGLSHLQNCAENLPRYLDLLVFNKLFGFKRKKKKVWWDWTVSWRTILRKERRKKIISCGMSFFLPKTWSQPLWMERWLWKDSLRKLVITWSWAVCLPSVWQCSRPVASCLNMQIFSASSSKNLSLLALGN